MTVIVKLKGRTIIENAFPLLDITRLDLPIPIRPTKKYKIPFCGISGAILSAKFQDITRGIVKSKSKRSFLNSVTIDICTSKKNISAKLSGVIIHMCGPNSEDLARETARHIIDHLLKLQRELDYINQDITTRDAAIQWIKDNTIGQKYIIDTGTQEIIELEEGEIIDDNNNIVKLDTTLRLKEKETKFEHWHPEDQVKEDKVICNKDKPYIITTPKGEKQQAVLGFNFFVRTETDDNGDLIYHFEDIGGKAINIVTEHPIEVMEVNSIVIPKEYPDSYSDTIDGRIVNFYIKYAPDFAYHHVYCQFLDSVANIKTVTTHDLDIESINMAMINYSYSLGMSIDRWELANHMKGKNGFLSRYNNAADHCVTISLPYDSPKRKGKKNKPKCHTFMVYKSGIVTQSGPSIDTMRDAYYLFMDTIMEIRDHIIRNDKFFKLKYKPIHRDLVVAYS